MDLIRIKAEVEEYGFLIDLGGNNRCNVKRSKNFFL